MSTKSDSVSLSSPSDSGRRTRVALVAEYRRLNRALANERLPETEARALRRALVQIQAEIDAFDGTATGTAYNAEGRLVTVTIPKR